MTQDCWWILTKGSRCTMSCPDPIQIPSIFWYSTSLILICKYKLDIAPQHDSQCKIHWLSRNWTWDLRISRQTFYQLSVWVGWGRLAEFYNHSSTLIFTLPLIAQLVKRQSRYPKVQGQWIFHWLSFIDATVVMTHTHDLKLLFHIFSSGNI